MTFGLAVTSQFEVSCQRFSYPVASIIIKTYHSRLHLLFLPVLHAIGWFKLFLVGRFHVCLKVVYVRLGVCFLSWENWLSPEI